MATEKSSLLRWLRQAAWAIANLSMIAGTPHKLQQLGVVSSLRAGLEEEVLHSTGEKLPGTVPSMT